MGCNFSALRVAALIIVVDHVHLVVYRDCGDKARVAALTLCILVKTGDFHALLRVFDHFQMNLLQSTFILISNNWNLLLSLLPKIPLAEYLWRFALSLALPLLIWNGVGGRGSLRCHFFDDNNGSWGAICGLTFRRVSAWSLILIAFFTSLQLSLRIVHQKTLR